MSKKQARQFLQKLEKSAALRKKVNDASATIVQVAKDQGYKVTRAEISDALKEHWLEEAGEGALKIDPLNHVLSETPGF